LVLLPATCNLQPPDDVSGTVSGYTIETAEFLKRQEGLASVRIQLTIILSALFLFVCPPVLRSWWEVLHGPLGAYCCTSVSLERSSPGFARITVCAFPIIPWRAGKLASWKTTR
jgi:hypothetical protein